MGKLLNGIIGMMVLITAAWMPQAMASDPYYGGGSYGYPYNGGGQAVIILPGIGNQWGYGGRFAPWRRIIPSFCDPEMSRLSGGCVQTDALGDGGRQPYWSPPVRRWEGGVRRFGGSDWDYWDEYDDY